MKPRVMSRPPQQGGSAIIMAIFIVVVLAMLGGAAASVSTMQNAGSALDVMGAQAYQAAHAGVEWGMAKVRAGGSTACTSIGASPSGALFVVDTMNVRVSCSIVSSGAEAGVPTVVYTFAGTACNAAACPDTTDMVSSPNYVERTLAVTAEF